MYSEMIIGGLLGDRFAELEENLAVPIRVLAGNYNSAYSPPPWTETHAGSHTLDEAQEYGITVVSWAARSSGRARSTETIPGVLYADDEMRNRALFDIYAPEEPEGGELYVWDEEFPMFAATIEPRLVVYGFCFEIEALCHDLHFGRVFEELIVRSIDEDFASQVTGRRRTRERERFTTWCMNFRNRALSEVREQIESYERNAANYQNNLAATFASLRDLGARAEAMQTAIAVTGEEWHSIYERLEQHPRITEVGFDNYNRLTFVTDMITMRHPDHGSRTLGRFRVRIGIDGDLEVLCENLDYPRGGRNHPHIPAGGSVCWGDVGATVARYLGELQIMGLVELIFMFLESFNPDDDWGQFAALWYDLPDALEDPDPTTAAETATAMAEEIEEELVA